MDRPNVAEMVVKEKIRIVGGGKNKKKFINSEGFGGNDLG